MNSLPAAYADLSEASKWDGYLCEIEALIPGNL